MSWGGVIAAGGAIVGGLLSSKGAGDAADAQAGGAQAAARAQLQMYNQSRQDNMPGQYVGTQALNTLASTMGLNAWTPNTADYWSLKDPDKDKQDRYLRELNPMYDGNPRTGVPGTGATGGSRPNNSFAAFFASPDYQFRMNEGLQQLDRYNAANGRYLSGAQLKATQRYAGNLASGEFGNWWNRMSGLAGLQQSAATQNANNAMQTGQNLGNAYQNAADARASGYMGQANAWGQAINGIGNAFGQYYGR